MRKACASLAFLVLGLLSDAAFRRTGDPWFALAAAGWACGSIACTVSYLADWRRGVL